MKQHKPGAVIFYRLDDDEGSGALVCLEDFCAEISLASVTILSTCCHDEVWKGETHPYLGPLEQAVCFALACEKKLPFLIEENLTSHLWEELVDKLSLFLTFSQDVLSATLSAVELESRLLAIRDQLEVYQP